MELNKEFKVAAEFVNYTTEHIFLTGRAGTGKTTFLRHIIKNCSKKLIVAAPTGVAAINAGGVTLHSLFQLPLGTFIADYKKNWGADEDNYIINRHQLLSKIRINLKKRRLLQELELLIIDEISMVRADTLDAVDTLLRHLRKKQDVPFGGVQLLMIGDLFQLPPVVRNHELNVMNDYYNSPFFFDAIALKDATPVVIELTNIYRQDDEKFINLLNNIRNNVVDEEDYNLLHQRYFPSYQPSQNEQIITLTSHNAIADTINQAQLEMLDTKSVAFEAQIKGEFPESMYPMEPSITFKVGAQVMFIKNDVGEERRYYNGKIGVIERIDTDDETIKINFPKENNSLIISRDNWENVKYKFIEDKEQIDTETVGTFSQFPFKLAWAVTIHKSQGLTFDEAIIDAGKSFAPGQVYVALSRMTNMKGMVLKSKIHPASISVDERIVRYMNNVNKVDAYADRLMLGKREYMINKVKSIYQWYELWQDWLESNEQKLSQAAEELITFSEEFNDVKAFIIKWDSIGISFIRQIDNLIHHDDWTQLSNRINASKDWYEQEWQEQFAPLIKIWIDKTHKIKNSTTATKSLEYLNKKLIYRIKQLQQVATAINHYSKEKNMEESLELLLNQNTLIIDNKKEEKVEKKSPTKVISLEMFKSGLTVDEIAKKRNLVSSTIMGHLADGVKNGDITPDALFPLEKILYIIGKLSEQPNATWSEHKSKLGDEYSYDEIKVAAAYNSYLASLKDNQ